MEGVKLPSLEIKNCYSRNIFSNMLSNTSSDIISDMRVTYHWHYDQWYREKNRESPASGVLFKKLALLEVRYFTRNIYDTETVTSGLSYIVILKTKSFLKIT